jgi:hypothetical protein
MPKSSKTSGAAGRRNRSALPFLVLVIALAGAAGYWYGTRQQPEPVEPPRKEVTITRPNPTKDDVENSIQKKVEIDPDKDPIRQAVEAQIATADGKTVSAFPTGTKLVKLDVKDGTATLDFSQEFSGVNKSGDTGESLAYDALRKVLAQFATVKYMRVMVDGKVFEGEHSGAWAEVPVRDGNARVEGNP